jgi:hypothetical protein
MTCLLYWLTSFRGEDFKTFFSIGSYVKTMSADGSHLGWRSESLNIILKVNHLQIVSSDPDLPLRWSPSADNSFNMEPYGKKCFKIFSFETSKPI